MYFIVFRQDLFNHGIGCIEKKGHHLSTKYDWMFGISKWNAILSKSPNKNNMIDQLWTD